MASSHVPLHPRIDVTQQCSCSEDYSAVLSGDMVSQDYNNLLALDVYKRQRISNGKLTFRSLTSC